jgi:hypothetical protein
MVKVKQSIYIERVLHVHVVILFTELFIIIIIIIIENLTTNL